MSSSFGPTRISGKKRVTALLLGLVAAALLALGLPPAAAAAPVQFFYVPFPEDHVLAMLTAVELNGPSDAPTEPITSYITITAIADDTIVYYDQWENGFDTDIANTVDVYHAVNNPDGTQIWGNGNIADGYPAGVTSDQIDAGTIINLTNTVTTTTRQAVIDFDGGDKLAATKTVAVTRTTWAGVTGTLFAGCVEVFDTNNWGTDYRAPVGTNAPNSYQMFEYTALSIMAGEGGATVSVDTNNDGTYDLVDYYLDEGSSTYVTNVRVGAHVVSDNPVQVDIFSGDISSNYESRDSALIPTDLWADRYYTPVSTADVGDGNSQTTVWLYNGNASDITVTYERRNTSGNTVTSTVLVPAGGVNKQTLENATDGTGSVFYTTDGSKFYAYSTTDSASTDTSRNQAWDWSYTMIPSSMLTTQALIGLGIGRDPTSSTNPTENGNPVWVTTVGNGDTPALVYVDYDADPTTPVGGPSDPLGNKYDASYSLRELDQARIYVPTLALDATTSRVPNETMADTLTFSHTTGTDANRLMLVSVAVGNDAGTQVNVQNVTYGGVGLTNLGRVTAPAGGGGTPNSQPQVEIWALASPASGAANVVVTLAGGIDRTLAVGVTTFSGVDVTDGLTSAVGAFASAAASSGNTQSVDVTTASGQYVYNAVAAGNYGQTSPSAFTPATGQSSLWAQIAYSGDPTDNRGRARTVYRMRASGGLQPATGTNTTTSYTSTTNYPWAIAAVPINPISTKADQTGILVYTMGTDPANPDTNTKLAVAWGQDPWSATAGAPGLDVGTSIPPTPEFTAGKDAALYTDRDGDGYISPGHDQVNLTALGDVVEYTISVYNVSRLPVPDVNIKDHAPDLDLYDTSYVAGSTDLDIDQDGDGIYETHIDIGDDGSGTAFPLDGTGYTVADPLMPHGEFKVTFRVELDRYEDLLADTTAIMNDGSSTALSWTDPVDDKAYMRGRIGSKVWWDELADGVQGLNNNGFQESGIEGVAITLYRVLSDGRLEAVKDDNGLPYYKVSTIDGEYDFKGLLPGDYVVEFIPPGETQLTVQYQGADPELDSNAFNDPADPDTYARSATITIGGGQWDWTVDAGFVITNPTQAVVSSFDAYADNGRVVVGWETASETGTAGYYVERRVGLGDGWVRVNRALVPALFESSEGGSYSLVDPGAQPYQTLSYRLVEVEISGARVTHGPYEVTPSAAMPYGEASSQISLGREVARVPSVAIGGSPSGGHSTGGGNAGGSRPGGTDGTLGAQQLRIEVVEAGLYRLDASAIAAGLGMTEARAEDLIGSRGFKLTNRGKTVAYMQAVGNSALYFYGEAIDSIYTNTNVYWLSTAKGTVMANAKSVSAGAAAAASFVDALHVEEDLFPYAAGFHDPESDFWLWSYITAGDTSGGDIAIIDAEVPDVVDGVTLGVSLYAITTTGLANEHHIQARLNGAVLGETWWSGEGARQVSFPIPAGVLVTGANRVEIVALLDDGIDYSFVAVDSLDITYQRSTLTVDDQLLLTAAAKKQVRVSGLSSTGAWVLDVTAPLTPKVVDQRKTGGDAGAAWITFNGDAGREYLVATAAGALEPVAVTATNPSGLRTGRPGADYVVVTADALYDGATGFADYRAGQGLSSMVVTTSQIYDNFNYGIASPHAINGFIAYASTMWAPRIDYILLAGEGSYDYKDFTGNADSLVPPLMVDTEFGLAPSDVALADTQGADGVPEVAIGRIPGLADADLAVALAKIQAYEGSAGAWQRSFLIAADDADDGGNFETDCDNLAASLPGQVDVTKAYLRDLGADGVRGLLFGSFAGNALLVDYVGHAATGKLADEGLMATADVAGLSTDSALPIVNALTCLVGNYAKPGYESLSETLVKRDGAGAIAVLAPTAMEENDYSVRLGTLFAQKIFDSSVRVRLGKAVQDSLRSMATADLPVWFLQTYVLLGDPALRVNW